MRPRAFLLKHVVNRHEWDLALLEIAWGIWVANPLTDSFYSVHLQISSSWPETVWGLFMLLTGLLRLFALQRAENPHWVRWYNRSQLMNGERLLRIATAFSVLSWLSLASFTLRDNPYNPTVVTALWLAYRSFKSHMRLLLRISALQASQIQSPSRQSSGVSP